MDIIPGGEMRKILPGLLSVFFIFSMVYGAEPTETSTDESSTVAGEQLVREMWKTWKGKDLEATKNWIADGFQSVHQDGARNGEEEFTLLEGLNLGDYTLDNFQVTQNGDIIIATYSVSVHETIEGKVLPTAPAVRLSVFLKTDKGWQWIAHANLNPMDK